MGQCNELTVNSHQISMSVAEGGWPGVKASVVLKPAGDEARVRWGCVLWMGVKL